VHLAGRSARVEADPGPLPLHAHHNRPRSEARSP
jgi:hypothetical protein